MLKQNVYDENGKRIKTINTNYSTIYVYNGNDIIYEKKIANGITDIKDFIFALNKLQAVEENDGTNPTFTNYYYSDVLGSTRFVTDNSGNVLQESIFTPFGKGAIKFI